MSGRLLTIINARREPAAAIFLLGYLGAFLLSKYAGFLLGYGLDDYYALMSGASLHELLGQFVSQGRFSFAIIQYIVSSAHLDMFDFHALGLAGTAWFSGLLFAETLRPPADQNWRLTVALGAVLGSHPYFAEYVSFRQASLPMAFMFLFSWLALRAYARMGAMPDKRSMLVAAACGVVATGFNQLALPFLCIGVLFVEARQLVLHPSDSWRRCWKPLVTSAATGIAVGVPYGIVAYGLRRVFHIASNDRAALLALTEVPNRLRELVTLVSTLTIGDEPVVSAVPKFALLLVLAVVLLARPPSRMRAGIYALMVFFVAACLALLPVALSAVWWPVPRTLIAFPLVLIGTIALLAHRPHAAIVAISWSVLLFAATLFTAHSNSVLDNQLRLNRWDMLKANSIYTVASQRFGGQPKIVLNQPRWTYAAAPDIADGDLNVSGLSTDWAVKSLFAEATGTQVSVRITHSYAKDCAARAPFPAGTSLFQAGDEVVVCL